MIFYLMNYFLKQLTTTYDQISMHNYTLVLAIIDKLIFIASPITKLNTLCQIHKHVNLPTQQNPTKEKKLSPSFDIGQHPCGIFFKNMKMVTLLVIIQAHENIKWNINYQKEWQHEEQVVLSNMIAFEHPSQPKCLLLMFITTNIFVTTLTLGFVTKVRA